MLTITDEDKHLSLPLSGRDPLGTQPIWQHRARDVVPHLTAASRRAEGFHILLVTLAWWPEYARQYNASKNDLPNFFILLEQAFARACRTAEIDWLLPGRQRLYSGAPGLWIGLGPEARLLDNQSANGVWGLYRGPAKQAGLITDDNHIASERLLHDIRSNSLFIKDLFRDIAKLLQSPAGLRLSLAIRKNHHLVVSFSELVRRLPFRGLIKSTFVTPTDSQITIDVASLTLTHPATDIAEFVKQAIAQLPQHKETLTNIVRCEQFLATLDAAFEFICCSEYTDLRLVAADIPINLKHLSAASNLFRQSGSYSNLAAKRVEALLSLNLDSELEFVKSLIEHHANISRARRVAPWISIEENGRLDCRLSLDAPADWNLVPAQAWRYTYYLGALSDLHIQLVSKGKK